MKKISDIVASPLVSSYKGSQATYEDVKEQVRQRWGDSVAEAYSPITDVMPYLSWASHGFQVKRGEKALKSFTIVEVKNAQGEIVRKIHRTINLFHILQVERYYKKSV